MTLREAQREARGLVEVWRLKGKKPLVIWKLLSRVVGGKPELVFEPYSPRWALYNTPISFFNGHGYRVHIWGEVCLRTHPNLSVRACRQRAKRAPWVNIERKERRACLGDLLKSSQELLFAGSKALH
jgi:hypothetical protein